MIWEITNEFKTALKDLERAIHDIKEKYGNQIDVEFLQKKFKEIIKNMQNEN